MLKIYIKDINTEDKNYCMFNDAWFDSNVRKIDFNNDIIQIVKLIDEVKYIGDYRFDSKFKPGTAILVNELSTGCKTAINIAAFPDKIFTVAECGDNALQVIFNFKQGNIYLPYFVMPEAFENNIKIITNKTESQIIHNSNELKNILFDIFDD